MRERERDPFYVCHEWVSDPFDVCYVEFPTDWPAALILSQAKQKKVSASTNMAQIFTGGRSGFFFCWNFLYTNPACQPQLFKSREQ